MKTPPTFTQNLPRTSRSSDESAAFAQLYEHAGDVMPRQERIKSLILSTRSDFRASIVSYLTQAGFAAEKKFATKISDIGPMSRDPLLWNYVVDLEGVPAAQARTVLSELIEMIGEPRIHPLVYVGPGADTDAAALKDEFRGCVVVTKPISRQHLTDALLKPYLARHGHLKSVKKPDSQENALAIETIGHVKSTVENLKKLAADLTATDQLIEIGQRFNGVYGTFKFFETHPGYAELAKLSEIIDSVSQTYAGERSRKKVEPEHFRLMFEAARAAFELLKTMRDSQAPEVTLLDRCANLQNDFNKCSDLKKRNSTSQDDVDTLLAELGA